MPAGVEFDELPVSLVEDEDMAPGIDGDPGGLNDIAVGRRLEKVRDGFELQALFRNGLPGCQLNEEKKDQGGSEVSHNIGFVDG